MGAGCAGRQQPIIERGLSVRHCFGIVFAATWLPAVRSQLGEFERLKVMAILSFPMLGLSQSGAIVTAMLGTVVLSGLGLMDLRAVADYATSSTFLWPMIVGGFVLGIGFIVVGVWLVARS